VRGRDTPGNSAFRPGDTPDDAARRLGPSHRACVGRRAWSFAFRDGDEPRPRSASRSGVDV